jgi:hypothetical protein
MSVRMRLQKVHVMPRLGISECDIEVLLLEVDFPHVAVFVFNDELEE